ncbi:MAG: DUF5320 domain-containing protein [Bacteroidales bacterium]
MPAFNRRGPLGKGPRSGRGLGKCNPNNEITANTSETWPRYGLGRQIGRGLGRRPGRGMGLGSGRGLANRFGFGRGRGNNE